MPPKGKAKKNPGPIRKMPPPLPPGEILVDGINKRSWVLGGSIGVGGFGEIYLATPQDNRLNDYVIKIEPHENGPLFSELSYYRRVAKEHLIQDWVRREKIPYLPVPKYITSGNHEFKGIKYRFMVMQKFGTDIEKHFRTHTKFCDSTVCYLALRILEALEFLHHSEYVHADIKGSNLLTGLGCEDDRVYLVDYGLAYRYCPEGHHKEYLPDPRKTHDGTVEYTSIDAHDGVNPSRRGDLEILGYCLLQWACGKLPWEDNLKNKDYVASCKKQYKKNVPKLMKDCFGSTSGNFKFLLDYMTEVYKLNYADTPPYSVLGKIFIDQLKGRDPKKTLEWLGKKRGSLVRSPVVNVVKLSPVLEPKEKRRRVDVGGSMGNQSDGVHMNTASTSRSDPTVTRPSAMRPSALKRQKIEETDYAKPPPKRRKGKIGVTIPKKAPAEIIPRRKGKTTVTIPKKAPAERSKGKTTVTVPRKKGKVPLLPTISPKRKGKASPVRRSSRNKDKKPINYKDFDSSFDDPSSRLQCGESSAGARGHGGEAASKRT